MLSKQIKFRGLPLREPEIDFVDRKKLLAQLEVFRREWKKATCGQMSSVTLDLKLLLDDIDNIVRRSR